METGGLRLRRRQTPLSSSGQTALYSGRPAGEGIPHAASLPPCTPSRHCDSRPLRVRQSRRFLETGSLFPPLAALRRFPLPHKTRFAGLLWGPLSVAPKRESAFLWCQEKRRWRRHFKLRLKRLFPPVTGVIGVLIQGLASTQPHMQVRKLRALPYALCFSFAAAPWRLRKTGVGVVPDGPCFCFADAIRWVSKERRRALSNCQGAAAKRERQSIRAGPGLSLVSRADTGGKARRSYPGQTPVTGAASVPDEVRNAAAKPFSLDTIKRRFLFFLGKRERGF